MIAPLHFDSQVTAIVEDCVQFADESPKPEKGQLLENVFPDPRGFGIAEDGRCAGGSQQGGGRQVGEMGRKVGEMHRKVRGVSLRGQAAAAKAMCAHVA